jgi:predicted phosphodiesterase
LWTDFNLFGRSEHWLAKETAIADRPADRKTIRTDSGILTPAVMIERHKATLRWLEAELERDFDGKTIALTHHVPTMQGLPPLWRDDFSSAAFASHLDWLFPQVDAWVCGHTHTFADFHAGRCRVVINPRGRTVGSKNGFNPELVIEV